MGKTVHRSSRAKLGVGVVAVIALALALVPGTAQAEPHYYRNGVLLGSEPVPVIEWGTLVEKNNGATAVECRYVVGASVENPEGGGAGSGATESYDGYDCFENSCPGELGLHAAVIAESLPWPSVLVRKELTLAVFWESTGIKLNIECLEGETVVGSEKLVGSKEPEVLKGTSALHPGAVEYNGQSGHLEAEGSKGANRFFTEGKLKVLGYEEQEVINAKEK